VGSAVRYQLALRHEHWSALADLLKARKETAGVLTVRTALTPTLTTYLGRTLQLVPQTSYLLREPRRLSVASSGYVPALATAATDGAGAIFFHTHPRGPAQHSTLDDDVDRQIRSLFMRRTRQTYFISLVIGGSPKAPTLAGRVYVTENGDPEPLQRVRVVGDRLQLIPASAGEQAEPAPQFDRQVRAFGQAGQRLLAQLHAGVVGAGGTGSAVCEQLIRLGVGHITLVDDDVIEETNLTRIHEATRANFGQAKVALFQERADAIGTGSKVTGVRARLRSEAIARSLVGCDVIFGCTDDVNGRGILSRLAYWYLIPVFDMGFTINSHNGRIHGLFGRVTSVLPGTACLLCRGRISAQAMYYDALTMDERQARAREGYAPELGEPNPAVVTYTTLVASAAVSELLDRLFGIGSTPPPSELLLRIADRSISRTLTPGEPGHYCTDSTRWGLGDQDPLLGQLWPLS
jgi:molybdopterin/thiamine biosynthesis adenylyltransferase